MPSAKALPRRRFVARLAALAACGALLLGAGSGCSTTQETAALKQAESKRILAAREHRRKSKSHDHGSKQR